MLEHSFPADPTTSILGTSFQRVKIPPYTIRRKRVGAFLLVVVNMLSPNLEKKRMKEKVFVHIQIIH